jgi:hypothetical protein
MKKMQRLCAQAVDNRVRPTLEEALTESLGTSNTGEWLRFELEPDTQSPVLYFRYPTTQTTDFEYLRPEVKLEFGALTDQQPIGLHAVRPLIGNAFPTLFADWSCKVTALSLERTFWEKATILHAEFHRPGDSPTPDRYARHYFDTTKLLAHPQALEFLADRALCKRVVDWKCRYFSRTWARYDLAHHGSFKLAPPPGRRAALEKDYLAMRPMFMSDPPAFDALMLQLSDAEATLNA